MSDKTSIEWTNATWNPIRGCNIVSAGCQNCYAMRVAARFSGPGQPYEGLARMTSKGPLWTGKIMLVEEHLNDPLRWKRPRRVFVNSMSDLFHEDVPDEYIERVFVVMQHADQHIYQILTKRPERMRDWVTAYYKQGLSYDNQTPYPLKHIWLGVSAEDQKAADERIPLLLQTPAAVRWVSAEPLIGPIDLLGDDETPGPAITLTPYSYEWEWGTEYDASAEVGIDWLICGGESGPGARPMHPDWARQLRDQCTAAGVAYFFKQWGGTLPFGQEESYSSGWVNREYPTNDIGYHVGKANAGHLLDGVAWQQFPDDARQERGPLTLTEACDGT